MGKDYPMIVDLTIGKMTIKYLMSPLIPEDRSEECDIDRGVLVDGIPIKAERVEGEGTRNTKQWEISEISVT